MTTPIDVPPVGQLHYRKRCKVSGKRRYPAKVDALADNSDLALMARAYLCGDCGCWHLTSQQPGDR